MKKYLLFFVPVLALFAACEKGGENQDVVPEDLWQVKEVYVQNPNGIPPQKLLYEYDEYGRLSKITGSDWCGNGYGYSDDAITVSSGDVTIRMALDKDGFITKVQEDLFSVLCYENGRLAKRTAYMDADMKEIDSITEYEWKDGNCVSVRTFGADGESVHSGTYEFYETENKLSVVLVYGGAMITDFYRAKGTTDKNLVKICRGVSMDGKYENKYEYKFDEEGRPIEIVQKSTSSNNPEQENKTVYTITYY